MKCLRCTNQATLHITEIAKSEVSEIHLCEECAQKYLSGAQTESAEPVEESLSQEESDSLTCPQCGITFREFRAQGRFGCPHDYVVFHDELIPLLENIHGETVHHGKRSNRQETQSHEVQSRMNRLRGELKVAVEEEAYERAAAIRDEIQSLQDELRAQGELSE